MSDNIEKVIERVQAILRKADESKNDSEAERDVAISMANKMLLKHGLSMADVEAGDDDAGPTWLHEQSGIVTEGDLDRWKGTLLHRIASVYFCKAYFLDLSGGRRRWMIVGKDANVATAKAMHEFIVPQLQGEHDLALAKITRTTSPHQQQQARHARTYAEHAAIKFLRENEEDTMLSDLSDDELATIGREHYEALVEDAGKEAALTDIAIDLGVSVNFAKKVRAFIKRGDIAGAQIENLAVWRRSFYDFAISRVASRLRKIMRSDVADLGEAGSALVKNEDADLDRFLDQLNLGLRSRQSNRGVDSHGANAGTAAGERADLSGHRKVAGLGPRQLNA